MKMNHATTLLFVFVILATAIFAAQTTAVSAAPACRAPIPTSDHYYQGNIKLEAMGYDQLTVSTSYSACALRMQIGDSANVTIKDPMPFVKWYTAKYYQVSMTLNGQPFVFWLNLLDVRTTDTLPLSVKLVWDGSAYKIDGRPLAQPTSIPTPGNK